MQSPFRSLGAVTGICIVLVLLFPQQVFAGLPCSGTPTPNPSTFSSAPAPASATSISMTSTAATPGGNCISVLYVFTYFACGTNDGTGGTFSFEQAGTSYTDSGLQPNRCYGYTIDVGGANVSGQTNSATFTATSSQSNTYTLANTPGAPTLGTPTATTLTLTNAENSNPSANPATSFAVQITVTAGTDTTWDTKWVDSGGNPSASAVWLTDAQLDNLVITGLTSSVTYRAQSKARNQDSIETSLSSGGSNTTSAGGGGATRTIRIKGGLRLRGGVRIK